MNTFVTSPESREHLRHSRYNVSREMVEADRAEAIDLDPQVRELAIFRTNASRHLPGDVLVRAVDAHADDLRKRDQDAAEGRCEACGNAVMFNEPHGATCPLDEEALEEAAANACAVTPADITPEGFEDYYDFVIRAGERMTCPHCREEVLRKVCGGHLLACAKDKAAAGR